MTEPPRAPALAISGRRREDGASLLEMLIALSLGLVVVGAMFAFLETSRRGEARDQAFAQEIATTQIAIQRFTYDLRSATKIISAGPNTIEFLVTPPGTSTVYDIRYDCSLPDSLGAGYTRCARLASLVPATLPAPPATAGALDIVHVKNGTTTQYCSGATARSGSVFFYEDPSIPDTSSSPPPVCNETYVDTVAGLTPPYVDVTIKVPASGDLANNGLQHATTFATGIYLRNQDSGA